MVTVSAGWERRLRVQDGNGYNLKELGLDGDGDGRKVHGDGEEGVNHVYQCTPLMATPQHY